MPTTPISGTAAHCLQHYLKGLPPSMSPAGIVARKPIIAASRCSPGTILDWTKGQPPHGLMLNRVEHFLAKLGYRISELERLQPSVRLLGQLIADGILDSTVVQRQLAYQKHEAVLRILRGHRPTPDRLAIIERLVAEHAPPPSIPTPTSDKVKPTSRISPHKTAIGKDAIIEALAAMILGALPLAHAMESEPFTAADRDKLHQLAGHNEVHRLLYSLRRLSSETAHAAIPPQAPTRQGAPRADEV